MNDEVSAPDPVALPGPTPSQSRRRRRIIAGLAVIAIMAMGWFILGRGQKVRPIYSFDNTADRVSFSPDGRTLLSGGPKFETRPSPDRWAESGDLAWQPYLTLRDSRRGTSQLDQSLDSMKLELQRKPSPIKYLAFSRDGALMVAGGWDVGFDSDRCSFLRIWDAASGVEGPTLDLPDDWEGSAFDEGMQTLLVSRTESSGCVRIMRWETQTWQPLTEIVLTGVIHSKSAFAPDGMAIAIADFEGASVTLFDLPSGLKRSVLADPDRKGKLRTYSDLRFSPDGQTLAVSCGDGAVQLWDVPASRLRFSIHPDLWDGSLERTFVLDNRYLVFGSSKAINPTWIDRIMSRIPFGWAPALSYGEIEGRVHIIDAATGHPITTLHGVQPRLTNLALSPDGRTLATTGPLDPWNFQRPDEAHTTMIWDMPPAH